MRRKVILPILDFLSFIIGQALANGNVHLVQEKKKEAISTLQCLTL